MHKESKVRTYLKLEDCQKGSTAPVEQLNLRIVKIDLVNSMTAKERLTVFRFNNRKRNRERRLI